MDTYQETAVANGREALRFDQVELLAQLVDNDSLNNDERVAIQNAIRLYASKFNRVLHVTDGGAMYLTDDHDLRRATEVTRLA